MGEYRPLGWMTVLLTFVLGWTNACSEPPEPAPANATAAQPAP